MQNMTRFYRLQRHVHASQETVPHETTLGVLSFHQKRILLISLNVSSFFSFCRRNDSSSVYQRLLGCKHPLARFHKGWFPPISQSQYCHDSVRVKIYLFKQVSFICEWSLNLTALFLMCNYSLNTSFVKKKATKPKFKVEVSCKLHNVYSTLIQYTSKS